MVASTLGVAGEAPVPHEHGDADGAEELGELHPWATEMYERGLSFNGNERNKLFMARPDGSFADLSDLAGADSPLDGRAVLGADFDADGDVDIFVHNIQRERHNLYRNESDGKGFLALRLEATRGQHEAIGAVVVVEGPNGPVAQVLSRGSGYASCQPPELVFGLGAATSARVRVRWPGAKGREEDFGDVAAGTRALLVEGRGEPQPLERPPARLADPLPEGLKLGPGERVPPLRLVDASGEEVTLDPAAIVAGDDELYLNFWASYCRPCVEELPALQRIHQAEGQLVIAVSLDVPGHERARRALETAGTTFPAYSLSMRDQANEAGLDEVVDLLRLPIPTTLVIGPEGRLSRVLRGPLEAD